MAALAAGPRRPFSLTAFTSLLFALSLLAKLGVLLYLRAAARPREYSYVGADHPQEWPIARPYVQHAGQHGTAHFALGGAAAAAEWAALAPGGGVVFLGAHRQPFGLSMLHQLRCLDLLRAEVLQSRHRDGPTELARHCMNYLKQMILCRGDTFLEPMIHPSQDDGPELNQVYECRDWEAVYAKVRENQAEHARWQLAQQLQE